MIPASAMKPIIEVAVNGAPKSQCPSIIPMSVSGTGVRITRKLERSELPGHDEVDPKNGNAERSAHIPEGDISYLPLAVP